MVVLKYFVPCLALASSALAQCSTKGTLTITNTADATKLATCQTFTGSVAIDKKAVGMISLDGPHKIVGNIVASSVKSLTGLSSSSLQSIEGMMTLNSLSNLDTVDFPMLTSVQNLMMIALGSGFTTLGFTAGISSINDLEITSTYLTSFEGIGITKADTVQIVSNPEISQLTLPFTEITTLLAVRGNNEGLKIGFPKLQKAKTIEINQCSGFDVPMLKSTTGLVAVEDNTITSLSLPALTTAGGLDVSLNKQLKQLSAPKLKTLDGAFSIAYNTDLGGTISFPELQTVTGGPNITGVFTGLSLPKLQTVRGHATIISTKNIDNTVCKHFEGLGSNVLQGKITCHGKVPKSHVTHASGANGGTGGSNSGGSGGGNNNAAGHHEASLVATLTMFGIIAASFAWLL